MTTRPLPLSHQALLVAAKHGHAAAVRELLAVSGTADVNASDAHGRTALLLACGGAAASMDITALLLQQGADVDQAANDSATPLIVASEHGDVDCVPV